MRSIRIKFVDNWLELDPGDNVFVEALSHRYDVRLSDDPEYLFYSCHGVEHLEYDVPRIFYTQENLRPDFNSCDYALGFDRLTFADRYFRFPLYLITRRKELLALSGGGGLDFRGERKFCSYIVSNGSGDPKREEIFRLLSAYRQVDSAGTYLNNVGYRVKDKGGFQSRYKFSISFENTSTPGYCTEKLIDAAYAGTIPIYWGDPDIGLDFNAKSFVDCGGYPDLESAVRRVIELDRDGEAYGRVRREPFLKRPLKGYAFEPGFEDFFYNIFDQDWKAAFRRNRLFWGKMYEDRIRERERHFARAERGLPRRLRRLCRMGLRAIMRRLRQKLELRLFGKSKGVLPER